MELYKNFSIGGLFQAGKRMAPPWGSFRRFTNMFKDPTGTFKPYGRGLETANTPTVPANSESSGNTFYGPISSQFFRKGLLQLHVGHNGVKYIGSLSYLAGGDTIVPIMQPFKIDNGKNAINISKHMTYLPSENLSSCVVARKAFINSCINVARYDATKDIGGFSPVENYLMAFDGIRPRGAGLPTPWTFVDPGGVPGAFYVRGIYATIGMDGELVLSNYLQQRISAATKNIFLSGYSVYPGTPRADVAGSAWVSLAYRRPEDHLFEKQYIQAQGAFEDVGTNLRYFDKRFIRLNQAGASVITTPAGNLTITNTDYSPALSVGDWIMLNLGFPLGGVNADLWMFKVKTLAGGTVTFETNFKYLDRNTVTWTDADFVTVGTMWNDVDPAIFLQFFGLIAQTYFTNIFLIVAYSTVPTSGFVVNDIYPIAWDSTEAGVAKTYSTAKVFDVPWAGIVSSQLTDWYDSIVVKTTFPPVTGITNYKELLIGFDSNALYFSDVSLGGSIEMTAGLANLIPYGTEYGDIVAICGSEDFLFISRERKNYILTGDIAGSNFNITECDLPVPGAYNAKSVSNAWAGQVIFVNRSGVFSVTSSGQITDISKEIKGLFFDTNRDQNLFDKSIFKTIQETRTAGKDGNILKFFLEDIRGYVVLLTAKISTVANMTVTDSNMLVYSPVDSKWYEFEGVGSSSAEAIYGKILSLGANRAKEDGVMRGTEKQLLVSQWMTIDAPSLQKQILQLKFFGELTPKTSDGAKGVTIGQQNEWQNFVTADRSGWKTNVIYTPDSLHTYFHKKRLDSSRPLATSIIFESLNTGSFTLDGMEVEGMQVQGGMKE